MKRRQFLRRGLLTAVAGPLVVSPGVLGRDGAVAPSEKITLAAIGLGNRGRSDLSDFIREKDLRCLTVCDCFADRRAMGKEIVDKYYGDSACRATRFHEEALQREDVDAVLIATGDRWHAVMSALAVRAGKDVYCEKPFSLTVGEGRALVELVERYGAVWQCGTQRRSNDSYRFVVDVVRKRMIGRLHTITCSLGGWGGNGMAEPQPRPDPEVFDYDRWLGQAPPLPYSPTRVALWRNRWDTGGGVIADMGAHYFDFAQWAHDSELSGPVEYEGSATWPSGGLAEVPFGVHVVARYADGVRLVMTGGASGREKGVRFDGDEGWINLTDDGQIRAQPQSILDARSVPRVSWAYLGGHVRNFLDCIRSRRRTVSHPELAHRSHTICHAANLCLRLGRKLRWDSAAERFVDDLQANRMLRRSARAPWRV